VASPHEPWYRRKLGNLGRVAIALVFVAIVLGWIDDSTPSLVAQGVLIVAAIALLVVAFVRTRGR
jgi:hypothetical protein